MKLSNFKTKATALFLALAVILSGIMVAPATSAQAAEQYDTIYKSEAAQATALENYTHNFVTKYTSATYVTIYTTQITDISVLLADVSQKTLYSTIVESTDPNWGLDPSGIYYYDVPLGTYATANYTLNVAFTTDVAYQLFIDQTIPSMKLSHSSLIVTKGFSSKLTVSNASGTVKWSSNKPKVAAVDSKGNVTGKATGTATITATATDGTKATCTVSVKANTYSRAKATFSDCSYGNAIMDVYKISYNNKGDLVIKANFLNNRGYKVVKLANIKITVKNKSNQVIGTYSLKTKKVSILHGGQKAFTFTIKKAKLKKKTTQDLRNASAKASGKYYTQY